MIKTINIKEILTEFEGVTRELLQLISSFDQKQINTIPFEGSWTASQVAEHLFKSDSLIAKTLYTPAKSTEREYDENIRSLKETFLDFDTKLTSPDFIIPAVGNYNKETVLNHLKNTRTKIKNAITTLDLSETSPATVLGELTRLELIHFVIYHTQRHIHQLKNIFKKVVDK
jgi:hypothetical protein